MWLDKRRSKAGTGLCIAEVTDLIVDLCDRHQHHMRRHQEVVVNVNVDIRVGSDRLQYEAMRGMPFGADGNGKLLDSRNRSWCFHCCSCGSGSSIARLSGPSKWIMRRQMVIIDRKGRKSSTIPGAEFESGYLKT